MGPRVRGEGQGIGGNATLLVDATVRFLEEFVHEEKMTQQSQQQTGHVNTKEEDEKKEDDGVDSFIPTYVYDAMKEKKRFDNMRVRPRAHVALSVTDFSHVGRPSGRRGRVFRLLSRHNRGRVACTACFCHPT